ncbi:Similar to hypothetical protein AFUA_4G00380 [Aspergillus fumigatus Af293]; acc. no. XP_746418 [Pyronema omphalodes CBS 100304]|uniref:Uncharacterized protein n=1 Tax=Pyronema omphalodes (strain CBS 100304) TaxID=1076935 RepID=U4LR12_PYROM|nr:Similar to hypothetical protein AFUA_4G00380 [Aspergillus fumigatus Af293]; acc. no. XP_746418 [Pyronema omphalodes CBS 100304]
MLTLRDLVIIAALALTASATLNPATSNTKGKCPSEYNCSGIAYTCTAPTSAQMTDVDEDCWTFFWGSQGEETGYGTTCIKDPTDGTCGCENSDGTFVKGSSSCV